MSNERTARNASIEVRNAQRASRRRRLVSWRFGKTRGPAIHLSPVQARYVDDVDRRIRSGAYHLEHGACVCGTHAGAIIAQVDRYGIALDTVLCAACGTLRFDPYLAPESLAEFYRFRYQQMYARAPDPGTYFARQRLYGRRLLEGLRNDLPKSAVVAEVGCGAGGALAVFAEAGHATYGCDYSAELVAQGRLRGVENLAVGDVETLIERLSQSPRKADLVFLHHVFEHVGAPVAWLVRAKDMLSENGVIVVAVPDVTAIHRYPSPKGDLRQFLHIAHKFNFSTKGLAALAAAAGLHASYAGVQKSDQAPEMWVSFSRKAASPAEAVDFGDSDARALFRYLRATEVEWLRQGVRRRLVRSLDACALAVRRVLPNRHSSG
jgi:SAM-dependent methyltransferase